ncbi:solute carrier family 2, facilitated glucose transporter member 1-like [Lingula anatina]|uniref:Solute carrier family 2, facilitated glucose transporter member 1-like n=1 Tax=Lingula anatina TaxID=7574 RepID=A0A1S3K2S0_LINAN|nr:solute carrier family 2, facilitated glucose transporter member 1-like [Lingula anatina]|eukprot:XP_013416933.1 solute carrier family 2, facilitated glucose transporter member 1-like [Lingula anatina]
MESKETSEREPLLSKEAAHALNVNDDSDTEEEDLRKKEKTLTLSQVVKQKAQGRKKALTGPLVLAMFAAVIGCSFQVGYATGVLNEPQNVLKEFINATWCERYHSSIHPDVLLILWSVIVSIFCAGGMVGGFAAGYLANHIGRKNAMMIINIISVAAIGLQAGAKYAKSFEMIIVGRFLIGVHSGLSTGVAPMYLNEIAPLTLRGAMGTINQLFIVLGMVTSQVLGLKEILGTDDLYPYLLGAPAVAAVLQLVLLPMCPASPRYLLLNKHQEEKARKALMWFRHTVVAKSVEHEIVEMKNEHERNKHLPKVTVCQLFRDPMLREPLMIALVANISQQLSGINAVTYYSIMIYEQAGLNDTDASYATVGMGGIMFVMTGISAVLVDRAGRRTLHLVGLGGMCIFTVVMTISFVYSDPLNPQKEWISYISIVGMISFTIFFSVGPGSIPWFLTVELFAQNARSAASSLATPCNWAANFMVGLLYPIMQKNLQDYSFLPFTGLLALFWLFTYIKLPETKGQTAHDMCLLFESRVSGKPINELRERDIKA